MDIRAYLKSRNLNDDNIEKLMTEPSYAPVLESLIAEAENGKTALQNAQKIEADLKKWNENEVVPYVRKADEEKAKVSGELAQMKAHMKSLKDAGYDIPEAYLEAQAPPPPKKEENSFDPKIIDQRAMEIAETNMALVSLSNKYRKLTGDELDLDSEYSDFKANRRPDENLRSYVGRKYDLAAKEKAAADAREQKRLDDYASEKIKAAKAEWTSANGPNPETRNPKSSKFDAIRTDRNRDQGPQLWQTAQGREEATRRRLEKYTSLVQ